MNLAACLRHQGRGDEAEKFAARTKAIDADLRALADASERAAKDPKDPAPRHEAGVVCLRNGQDEQALRWFAGALQVDPKYRPTHKELSEYYARAGRPDLSARHHDMAARP